MRIFFYLKDRQKNYECIIIIKTRSQIFGQSAQKHQHLLMMSIFDSPSESENEQQIIAHDYYYNSHLVEDNVSAGLLSFLYLLLMSLSLFTLFEHEYQLYYVNTNNNTNDSFLRHNTNNSLI